MELFTKLEKSWDQAVRDKNQDALKATLAPEFVLRSSSNPDNIQPRAEWLRNALTTGNSCSLIHRAMSIRSFMDVAVVSFVQDQQPESKNTPCPARSYLVVDVWEVNHQKWQVASRFVATARTQSRQENSGQPRAEN